MSEHYNTNAHWLTKVEDCVAYGGPQLSKVMSDKEEGVNPTLFYWYRVAEAIFKHSYKSDRMRMIRVFLAQPDLPAQFNESHDILRAAILNRAHECVPLIHEKGFMLQDRANAELIAFIGREIFKGRWPHPDLVMPELLEHSSIHLQIAKGVLRECSNQGKRITHGLGKLHTNESFNRLLSKIVGRRAEEITVRQNNYDAAVAPLFRLYAQGILNLDIARAQAIESSQNEAVHPILTHLEKMVISTRSPEAHASRPGRRL